MLQIISNSPKMGGPHIIAELLPCITDGKKENKMNILIPKQTDVDTFFQVPRTRML